jgi:hypothetical protein
LDIGFLILCSFVLIDVSDTITTAEVFLFVSNNYISKRDVTCLTEDEIWIIAYLMEEVSQFRAEGGTLIFALANAHHY